MRVTLRPRAWSWRRWARILRSRSVLRLIIWHILATGRPYDDLGHDYFDRRPDPEREARRLIARLEALGKHVTVDDAA